MIIVILILVAIVALCLFLKERQKEDFKVLGSMGNLKGLYYQCLNQCEKSDPAKNMSPTKGSMACQAYCDSIITDLARRGGPSYRDDLPIGNVNVITNIDKTYASCGDGTHGARCRSLKATDYQIDDKCRQDCEYSTLPKRQCMERCSQTKASSKSTGWSWK
ncbi:MAG TPA: hypothetical protein PKD85_05805 [Saprospiraceae bacterium]|nr:hypothetical protein [Saprospiraceae bacterium]